MSNPLDDFYTDSEKYKTNYTVYQALESAKARNRGKPVNEESIRGRQLSEKITLRDLNLIADKLVQDSRPVRSK